MAIRRRMMEPCLNHVVAAFLFSVSDANTGSKKSRHFLCFCIFFR